MIISSQCCNEGSNWCHKSGKRNKSHQFGKGEVKLSLFTDNMIVNVENLMVSTVNHKNSEFSKVKYTETIYKTQSMYQKLEIKII